MSSRELANILIKNYADLQAVISALRTSDIWRMPTRRTDGGWLFRVDSAHPLASWLVLKYTPDDSLQKNNEKS
jgi:hypothetical protein